MNEKYNQKATIQHLRIYKDREITMTKPSYPGSLCYAKLVKPFYPEKELAFSKIHYLCFSTYLYPYLFVIGDHFLDYNQTRIEKNATILCLLINVKIVLEWREGIDHKPLHSSLVT